MPLTQLCWAKYSSGEKRNQIKRAAFKISTVDNSETLSACYKASEVRCGASGVSAHAAANIIREKDWPLAPTRSKHWDARWLLVAQLRVRAPQEIQGNGNSLPTGAWSIILGKAAYKSFIWYPDWCGLLQEGGKEVWWKQHPTCFLGFCPASFIYP